MTSRRCFRRWLAVQSVGAGDFARRFRYSPDFLFCGDTATVASQTYFFCLARKSRQKDALGTRYIARSRARISFNALFGRRIAIFPIAYTSGECTTRRCRQTASISLLLISGILGRLRSCTAPCRGRCPHRPVWEPTNSPQISVKMVHTARADVGIGPYKHLQSNTGGQSYPAPTVLRAGKATLVELSTHLRCQMEKRPVRLIPDGPHGFRLEIAADVVAKLLFQTDQAFGDVFGCFVRRLVLVEIAAE